ncbi:MAG: PQQ-binding-like beta-propeller repeat protein [Nocardioidaceae bacterium]|nr:PQQ-binding-like beta-propeller repeat protein [Nocardioidaceae bacterium]
MFCSRCGHEVGDAESYCPACGLALSPATIASTPPMVVDGPGQRARPAAYDGEGGAADLVEGPGGVGDGRPARRRPRRRALVGIGVVVLAMIGAGAWFSASHRGSGTFFFPSYGEAPLPRPVTSEPEQRWKRDLPNSQEAWVVPDRGVTYISTVDGDSTTIVAIEDDGRERWSVEDDATEYVFAASPDGSTVLALPWGYEEDSTRPVRAFSAEDGSLRWKSQDGEPARITDDGVVLLGENVIELADLRDGSTIWKVDNGSSLAINSDLLVVSEPDTLTAYDIATGDKAWSTGRHYPCATTTTCRIAASDDVVLVKGGIDAVAYDPANGEELWSERVDQAQDVGVASAMLVYVQSSPDQQTHPDRVVTVYDRSGRRGELAVNADNSSWFFPVGVTTAGTSWVLDWSSGTLYDDRLAEVDQIDGDVAITGGGAYALDGNELSYRRFDRRDPVWTLNVSSDAGNLQAGEGSIVLTWADSVALYQ